jgi:hypothetical protein
MNGNRFLPLLGLPHTDPDVRATLRALHIMRDPEVAYEDEEDETTLQTQDFVGNLHLGIEFGFEDEASFKGLHREEIGAGPMIMTHIYLFLESPNSNPFEGTLPFGLDAKDGVEAVRRKMAEADRSFVLRSYIRDVWENAWIRVIASYSEARRLEFLVVMLPPKPVTVDPEDAERLPSAGRILTLLGTDRDDKEFAMALRSLQFSESFVEVGDTLLVPLASRWGLTLKFSQNAHTRGFVLSSATFSRSDAANDPQWPLDLPHNITFDMSPSEIFVMLGPPKSKHEDEFTGRANWLFPSHELSVVYSTMDNLVLDVEIRTLRSDDQGDDDA